MIIIHVLKSSGYLFSKIVVNNIMKRILLEIAFELYPFKIRKYLII